MAHSASATLIDDIDQTTASETVRFGVDGTAYEIDLSAKHARELRSVVARYISAARRIRSAPSSPSPQQPRPRTRARTDTQPVAAIKADVRGGDHGLTDGEMRELRTISDAAGPSRTIVAGRLHAKGLVDRDTAGTWWLTDAGRRELMSR
jgi:hypothetical protein